MDGSAGFHLLVPQCGHLAFMIYFLVNYYYYYYYYCVYVSRWYFSLVVYFSLLFILYCISGKSKLWNTCVFLKSTSDDANRLERVERKFPAFCFYSFFFLDVNYNYANALRYLKLLTLRERRCHFDMQLFKIIVYVGSGVMV